MYNIHLMKMKINNNNKKKNLNLILNNVSWLFCNFNFKCF